MSSYRPITDTWIVGRPKVGYYGAYPAGFLERARWLLPVTIHDPVLHVCGGKARAYSDPAHGVKKGVPLWGFGPNDLTVDLDAALSPDFLADVSAPDWAAAVAEQHFRRKGRRWPAFRGILIDRPYTEDDADKYAPGRGALPTPKVLLNGAYALLSNGGRVGMLDYLWPKPPQPDMKAVAKVCVTCGFNNRDRCFSVFEKRS